MFSPLLRGAPTATPKAATPCTPHRNNNIQLPSVLPVLPPTRATTRGPRAAVVLRSSLYDLLGVTSAASTAEIRTAYRRLAARYHPDQNSSLLAHEKFQALNLAAEVLTEERLRRDYDRGGTAALPSSRYKFLLDFLKQARAQGGLSVLGEPGSDLSTVLGLDFNEAVTGSAAAVTLDVLAPCGECKGSGFEASSQTADCRVCRGSGEIMVRTWSPEAGSTSSLSSTSSSSRGAGGGSSSSSSASMLMLPRGCPACRGSGKTDQQECKQCEGEGRVQLRRKVRFRVPGGVVDGQVLRVKGQGHSGKYGGAPGDLLVKLQVYDLADVTRHGYDLHSVLELPLYEALLGASVAVRTVRGHRHILVPAGTQHGQLLCVKGAGVPRPGSNGGVEYGHHYFEVSVRVPSAAAVSEPELHLLQRLGAAIQQLDGRVHHGRFAGRQHQQWTQKHQQQQEYQQHHQQQQQDSPGRIDQERGGQQQADAAQHQEYRHQQDERRHQQPAAGAAGVGASNNNHQHQHQQHHNSDPP